VSAWHTALAAVEALPTAQRAERLQVMGLLARWLPPTHLDALADALVGARAPKAAAGLAQEAALRALDEGRVDVPRWLRYVDLVGDRSQRIRRPDRFGRAGTTADAPAEEVAALLRRLDAGGLAARLACLVVLQHVGERTRWPDRWWSELEARRRDGDPDVAEAAWRLRVHRS
jgi:hypothetical protein